MGRRPCFPDSLPVIGRAPGQTGLWLDFGHAHWGLTLGPVSGRLLAEMMTGDAVHRSAPYRAERFSDVVSVAATASVRDLAARRVTLRRIVTDRMHRALDEPFAPVGQRPIPAAVRGRQLGAMRHDGTALSVR